MDTSVLSVGGATALESPKGGFIPLSATNSPGAMSQASNTPCKTCLVHNTNKQINE